MAVWRIAQTLINEDLSFWAGATKTSSVLVAPACCMLTISIFLSRANEKKWETVHNFST